MSRPRAPYLRRAVRNLLELNSLSAAAINLSITPRAGEYVWEVRRSHASLLDYVIGYVETAATMQQWQTAVTDMLSRTEGDSDVPRFYP